jgi:hypothetical protein
MRKLLRGDYSLDEFTNIAGMAYGSKRHNTEVDPRKPKAWNEAI